MADQPGGRTMTRLADEVLLCLPSRGCPAPSASVPGAINQRGGRARSRFTGAVVVGVPSRGARSVYASVAGVVDRWGVRTMTRFAEEVLLGPPSGCCRSAVAAGAGEVGQSGGRTTTGLPVAVSLALIRRVGPPLDPFVAWLVGRGRAMAQFAVMFLVGPPQRFPVLRLIRIAPAAGSVVGSLVRAPHRMPDRIAAWLVRRVGVP